MINGAYRNALDQAKADLRDKIDEIKSSPLMSEILELHQALNTLESLLKEPKTSLGELFNLAPEGHGSNIKVRFDEFVGLTSLESAKRYLKKCPDARPFSEIAEAIVLGGGKVSDEDDLKTSLTRSTLDIIKIGDRFGDIDKYPHIKRGGKKKKGVLAILDGDADEVEDEMKDLL
jgi:hypothetical protein